MTKRIPKTDSAVNDDYVHLELMSTKAEDELGGKPFVFILKTTYETDNTEKIIIDSLQHSAEVLNKTAEKLTTQFPYIAYPEDTDFGGVNRNSSWVYLSLRNIPAEVENIKAWMLKIATNFTTSKGLKLKQMRHDATPNTATLDKFAWRSTDISPL